jgi:3-carboxy-cis,cis-muconate cycloisomerase
VTSHLLHSRPATTLTMLAVYDDSKAVQHALAFEAALANAQAYVGLIDHQIAKRIVDVCASIDIPPADLADETAHAGTLAIPLVQRLRVALSTEPAVAAAVHRGATSQDLADTVAMLQAREAVALIDADLKRVTEALKASAERYAQIPAVGRTLLRDAQPITFGLRVAQWLAGVDSARQYLKAAAGNAIVIQLGGAVGTRSGLGQKGHDVAVKMAEILGLNAAVAPWHSRRAHVVALAAALGITIGSIGKIGRDVSLLAQNAVAEVTEPAVEGRGGSSAMPHKRNPIACQVALSAAIRAPALVASLMAGMTQELERGLGGWQAEAPVLAELFMLAAGSTDAIAAMLEGLEVHPHAIARNLETAEIGSDVGAAATIVDAILQQHRKDA